MKRFTRWSIAVGGALLGALAAFGPASAAAPSSPVTIKWQAQAIVNVTLTSNYATGYGSVKAVFGTQPAPVHGPDATGPGTPIDFGSVLAGNTYLYKYAAHVNVVTNSSTGFDLYGEGAADFFNTVDSSTQTLNQTLYYVNSTSGSPADSNTGFSPGLPFYRTAGAVTGNGQFTTPSISYTTYPSPIAADAAATGDFYYDYQMKVPPTATSGLYYVWIVYTVVPK